jgi:hypothetical protein
MTILLIDDEPSFTEHKGEVSLFRSSKDNPVIAENFNLIWLRDIKEIKMYYDGIRELKNLNSKRLSYLKLLPEIIVFDYCLTRGKNRQIIRENNDPTFPNIKLFEAINEISPYSTTFLNEVETNHPKKSISQDSANDSYGLVSGMALFSFFSDYITAGIPTTAYPDIADSQNEMGYIEWLHEDQMHFADSERMNLSWGQLLFESLQKTRDHLNRLIKNNVVSIFPHQLINIKNKLEESNLTYGDLNDNCLEFIHAQYGKKKFLLSALFYDHFHSKDGSLINNNIFNNEEVRKIQARDPKGIINVLKELIDLAFDQSIAPEKYIEYHQRSQNYIKASNSNKPITSSFLTNMDYSKREKQELFIIAMIQLIESENEYNNPRQLRSGIKDIFFSGQTNDTKRHTLHNAGIKYTEILAGRIDKKLLKLIKVHRTKTEEWPSWWKV